MTLKKELIARIKANGPISIADFMTEALLHPTKGYYTSHNPFGSQGDFVTAPEISQMFGEIIGLSLAQSWLDQGSPSSFVLAELGPGRGTLMSDILRATHSIKGFNQAARLFLVEASASLKNIQKTILSRFNPTWISKIDDLPQAPLWLVANEFFDALPIQQFERSNDGWKERHIGLIEGSLCFGVSLANSRLDLAHRLEDTKEGDIIEIGLEVVKLGKTSITLRCVVQNKNTKNTIIIVEEIVFVCVGEDGKSKPHGITIEK